MTRYVHYLAPAKGAYFPGVVACLDCSSFKEAVNSTGSRERERLEKWFLSTMLGKDGTYSKVKQWSESSLESLWNLLQTTAEIRKRILVLLWRGHRILSLLNFWSYLEEGNLRLCGYDAREMDKTTRIRWRTTNGVVIMDDSTFVARVSFPDSKGEITFVDTRNFGIDRDTEPQDWQAWTGQVLAWYREACGRLKFHQLGGWKNTAGSQAMYSFRYAHLQDAILCHTVKSALELERKAYYGGRCECFQLGSFRGPIYHLDFRALYPHCCLEGTLPLRFLRVIRPRGARPDIEMGEDTAIIAEVTVETNSASYPLRKGANVIYPIGRFKTYLCGPELWDAAAEGRIVHWHKVAYYETGKALAKAAEAWMKIREYAESNHDSMLASWAKRCAVCLVGKFGQRDPTWIDCPQCVTVNPWEVWHSRRKDGTIAKYRALNWQVQTEVMQADGCDSVTSIAAWITSMGRMRLLNALRIAKRKHTMYCDTDSLIVNKTGYQLLQDSGMIANGVWGKLQLKGIHDNADILGIKHYALDGEVKCSGCPCSSYATGPFDGLVWYQLSIKTAMREGRQPDALRVLRSFERKSVYPLGEVLPSGLVKPFTMGKMTCE